MRAHRSSGYAESMLTKISFFSPHQIRFDHVDDKAPSASSVRWICPSQTRLTQSNDRASTILWAYGVKDRAIDDSASRCIPLQHFVPPSEQADQYNSAQSLHAPRTIHEES